LKKKEKNAKKREISGKKTAAAQMAPTSPLIILEKFCLFPLYIHQPSLFYPALVSRPIL
jgi:hypothetical protein